MTEDMEIQADEVFGQSQAVTDENSADANISLEELFNRNADGLWRFFVFRCGETSQADDMMQELCLQLVRSKDKLAGVESLDNWLFGMAKNILRNHIRKVVRRRNNIPTVSSEAASEIVSQIDSGELPDEAMQQGETTDALMLAITSLSGKDQELVKLHYFEGLGFKEIAEHTGMTPRSIEGRLYRVRKTLRAKLGDLEI